MVHDGFDAGQRSARSNSVDGQPVTVVAGLGRCGTSMLMQMLDAGGVAVVGAFPAYEVREASAMPLATEWLASCAGRAVKILDPHRGWRGQCAARVIWLSRDHGEQARSQMKFLRSVAGVPVNGRATTRKFVAALRDDERKCFRLLQAYPMCRFRFEAILADPLTAARQLTAFFPHLNIEKAAAAVERRGPKCAPGLDMELNQIERSPRANGNDDRSNRHADRALS